MNRVVQIILLVAFIVLICIITEKKEKEDHNLRTTLKDMERDKKETFEKILKKIYFLNNVLYVSSVIIIIVIYILAL